MKIYISGAISSDPDYFDKFQRAALKIRTAGHLVITPTCLPDGLYYDDIIGPEYRGAEPPPRIARTDRDIKPAEIAWRCRLCGGSGKG